MGGTSRWERRLIGRDGVGVALWAWSEWAWPSAVLPHRPYLHLGELERVLPAGPGGPLDAVGVGRVGAAEVLPVEVGRVAVAVPPGPAVEGRAVVLRVVAVAVLGGEPHAAVLQERVPCADTQTGTHVQTHANTRVHIGEHTRQTHRCAVPHCTPCSAQLCRPGAPQQPPVPILCSIPPESHNLRNPECSSQLSFSLACLALLSLRIPRPAEFPGSGLTFHTCKMGD